MPSCQGQASWLSLRVSSTLLSSLALPPHPPQSVTAVSQGALSEARVSQHCLSQALGEDPAGLLREEGGAQHPAILFWGIWSARGQGLSCREPPGMATILDMPGAPGLSFPNRGCGHHPQLRPCLRPLPGSLRDIKPGLRASGAKLLRTIQTTPLPASCGSFQTFAEALRIFLRAGAPPNVGSAPGLVPKCKVGHKGGRRYGI